MTISDIERLKNMMRDAGATMLYVKKLSPNDNSKNQPYFGGDFSVLNILPYGDVQSESLGKVPNFKAKINFYWMLDDGLLEYAKHAQLILYPKYPEVRFSGFLLGCKNAPNHLMNIRAEGRLLFLGTTPDGRILGHVAAAESLLSASFHALGELTLTGVFYEIPLDTVQRDTRKILLNELHRISELGWIESKRLVATGQYVDCLGQNCGGMTLEAMLNILPNSLSEPDFHGWEVKQHSVKNLSKPDGGRLTLMTPEPTAGFYKTGGVEAFVRKYGYADMRGRDDRFNFGGVHKVGERHPKTKLTMVLEGFDANTGKIINTDGGIVLRDDQGNSAAEWKFTNVIEHWRRKHAKAVYVPSLKSDGPLRYRYGSNVRLGIGTDPIKLLEALQRKSVFYDPGIKLENASAPKPKTKRRSQFRVSMKNIDSLYSTLEDVDVSKPELFSN